ncbi:hypothetical protein [Haloplanus pelagicus]|jgi:hypothetical protein|uniref:hypothetical protein n=1 Tax=Haloplanus pelagicus TaxID=2949995 RepID=UPI00203B527D|nr:hypothetical protein [Haloplanus sp. HW8-1]
MLRRLRETGPGLLVPLAWTVVVGAHLGAVSIHALFVAHLVMAVLLPGFAVTGWTEMSVGVLRTWRSVVAVGFVATALGVVGFLLDVELLLAVALYAWMGLPAGGLLRTGAAVAAERTGSVAPSFIDAATLPYLGGGVLCALGVAVYAVSTVSPLLGLVLVGVGQTAGILDAVVRY